MKVLKFGGTSVGSVESIKKVIDIISKEVNKNKTTIVVVSAFSKITDTLIALSESALYNENDKTEKLLNEIRTRHINAVRELVNIQNQSISIAHVLEQINKLEELVQGIKFISELSNKTRDKINSFGELLSGFIINQAFISNNLDSVFLDASKILQTDSNFGNANIIEKNSKNKTIEYFEKNKHKIVVVTGFIASNGKNEITTLGRGGSDYTASLIGSYVSAKSVEIWTDVDGVMSCDPKIVSRAFSINIMTYLEALEMSHFGSKVIYPPTILPIIKYNIPLYIKNTFNPSFEGTEIKKEPSKKESNSPVKGISFIKSVVLINVNGGGMIGVAGIAHRIYETLYQNKVSIILITQSSSEHSITLAVSPLDAEKAYNSLNEELELEIESGRINPIKVERDFSIIAVVGDNMRDLPGTSGKVFGALGKFQINVVGIAQGSSKLNISIIIKSIDIERALNAIHDTFFYPLEKIINVFLLGVGNIGKTLIKQIVHHNELSPEHKTIKIISISNSKNEFTDEDGIDLKFANELLKNSNEKADLENFIKKMDGFKYPNKVFVDCTSSEEVSKKYSYILSKNIHVVVANKKANSNNYKYYNEIKEMVRKVGYKYLYESNVGAGLPIIKTFQNLISSGDKIERIECVLSGSLSYIFNLLSEGEKTFSEIVKDALEKGYLEPNPKDDLDGMDFARKLVIVGREIGYKIEKEEVKLEYIIPEEFLRIKDKNEFISKLPSLDNYFNELILQAKKENKKLCYIGKLEGGKASLSLEKIDVNHPFYGLSKSDNIISIKTEYYPDNLVIRGSGAGPNVTASGVLANIFEVV